MYRLSTCASLKGFLVRYGAGHPNVSTAVGMSKHSDLMALTVPHEGSLGMQAQTVQHEQHRADISLSNDPNQSNGPMKYVIANPKI